MGKKSRKKREKRTGQSDPLRDKRRVLADHARQGRRLVPPLAQFPLSYVSWNRDLLPDLLWIALLIDTYGPRRGVELTLKLVEAAETVRPAPDDEKQDEAVFGWTPLLIDCYSSVSAEGLVRIVDRLDVATREAVQAALLPLVAMYSGCPLEFLIGAEWRNTQHVEPAEAVAQLARVMRDAQDRRGKLATWVQGACVYCAAVSGRLTFSADSAMNDFPAIQDYPDTEKSRMMASLARASVNAFLGRSSESNWPKYFWNHGYDISVCEYPVRDAEAGQTVEERFRQSADAAELYARALVEELQMRWASVRPNLAAPTRDEVLGALLARQARLSSAIARDPRLWAVDLGQMMLRSMVETYLTVRWLGEKGQPEDFRRFVEYGLGQEKLLLEHMKAQLPEEADGRLPDELEPMQSWIDSQLYTFLLPVQLTTWKSVRGMAEDLGELDVYDLNFARYSSELHGSWNSLAKVNLKVCINPLHTLHRTPTFDAPALFLGILSSAVGLMHDTYEAWVDAMAITSTNELESVREFYARLDETESNKPTGADEPERAPKDGPN